MICQTPHFPPDIASQPIQISEEKFNADVFRRLGELGLLGVTVPPEYGGSGMDASAACIIHEELSAADPACCLSYLGKNSLLGPVLRKEERGIPSWSKLLLYVLEAFVFVCWSEMALEMTVRMSRSLRSRGERYHTWSIDITRPAGEGEFPHKVIL